MISQLNPYLNGDFDPDNAANYILLLSIGESEFSYMVIENDTLIAFGKQQPNAELSKPLTLGNQENIAYKQVIAGIIPKDFSIVPNELFSDSKLPDLEKFLNGSAGDQIFNQELNNDNKIVYNCEATLYTKITESYPNAGVNFCYKGWIQAIAKKSPFNETLYLDIQPGCLRATNFKDEKLRFYNRYITVNQSDVVYYTALVAQELGISMNDILLSLSGDVVTDDANINALKEFFVQVEINKISLLEHLPDEVEPQQALAISALQLCV